MCTCRSILSQRTAQTFSIYTLAIPFGSNRLEAINIGQRETHSRFWLANKTDNPLLLILWNRLNRVKNFSKQLLLLFLGFCHPILFFIHVQFLPFYLLFLYSSRRSSISLFFSVRIFASDFLKLFCNFPLKVSSYFFYISRPIFFFVHFQLHYISILLYTSVSVRPYLHRSSNFSGMSLCS